MEWVTTEDLMLLEEMPNTPQGIRKKAKTNQWKRRKKEGTRGYVYEYAVSSLPLAVQEALREREALRVVRERTEVVVPKAVEIRLNDKQRAVAVWRWLS